MTATISAVCLLVTPVGAFEIWNGPSTVDGVMVDGREQVSISWKVSRSLSRLGEGNYANSTNGGLAAGRFYRRNSSTLLKAAPGRNNGGFDDGSYSITIQNR